MLVGAVDAGADDRDGPDSGAWIVAASPIPGTAATAFVARPMTAAFIDAIDHNIDTAAGPGGHPAHPRGPGARDAPAACIRVTPALRHVDLVAAAHARVARLASVRRRIDVRSAPDFTLAVTTPFAGPPVGWQSILLLLAVILVAMLFIVVVVQIDLRIPSAAARRRGRGAGERRLRPARAFTARWTRSAGSARASRRCARRSARRCASPRRRAAVAMELSLAQPLEGALANVCAALRRIDGRRHGDDRGQRFRDERSVRGRRRRTSHPLRRLSRRQRSTRRGLSLRAVSARSCSARPPTRPRRRLDVREFCVAPLRLGKHVHGVLAVAGQNSTFSSRRRRPRGIDRRADLAGARALPLSRGGAAAGERRRPHRPLQPPLPHRFTRAAGGARPSGSARRWPS